MRTATPRGTYLKCASQLTAGYTRAAIAIAASTHAMTRSALWRTSRRRTVAANANTTASAERNDSRTRSVRVASAIGSYHTDVSAAETGPPAPAPERAERVSAAIDLDPRSAIPLAIAFAVLAIAVWFVRSI